jgi:DNA polymerase-1
VQFGTRNDAYVLRVELDPIFLRTAANALRRANRLIIHNAPFDWLVCDRHVPDVSLETLAKKTTDTRIHAHLIDPRGVEEGGIGTKLKPLAAHYIDPGAPDTQDGLMSVFHSHGRTKNTGWDIPELIHNPTYLAYAGGDCILVSELLPVLEARTQAMGTRPTLIEYEHELARIGTAMTLPGLVVDRDYAEALDKRLAEEYEHQVAIAAEFGVDNVNSTDQVAAQLIASGVPLVEKTDKGAWKVDKTVLNQGGAARPHQTTPASCCRLSCQARWQVAEVLRF